MSSWSGHKASQVHWRTTLQTAEAELAPVSASPAGQTYCCLTLVQQQKSADLVQSFLRYGRAIAAQQDHHSVTHAAAW